MGLNILKEEEKEGGIKLCLLIRNKENDLPPPPVITVLFIPSYLQKPIILVPIFR